MIIVRGSTVDGTQGTGAVAENSPLNPQVSVREREKLGMVWAFETSEPTPQWHTPLKDTPSDLSQIPTEDQLFKHMSL